MCQCPKTGNSHFHLSLSIAGRCKKMCQCPKTGNSHFHSRPFQGREIYMISCVNALRRATLISTFNWAYDSLYYICVNALRRATLISTRKWIYFTWKWMCVNALRRATLISTGILLWLKFHSSEGCQCPKTGNSHFHQYYLYCCKN